MSRHTPIKAFKQYFLGFEATSPRNSSFSNVDEILYLPIMVFLGEVLVNSFSDIVRKTPVECSCVLSTHVAHKEPKFHNDSSDKSCRCATIYYRAPAYFDVFVNVFH